MADKGTESFSPRVQLGGESLEAKHGLLVFEALHPEALQPEPNLKQGSESKLMFYLPNILKLMFYGTVV